MKRLFSAVVTRLFIAAAVFGSLAVAARPARADETPGKPESTALVGGGFALDFKVWQPPKHKAAKSLTVTYTWGKAGTRTVAAQRQGVHWHVEFPDQPEPNEQASLKLRYAFELSDEDKATLAKAAHNLARAILNATVAAAEAANPAPAPAPPKPEATGTDGSGPAGAATAGTEPAPAPEAPPASTPPTPDFPTAFNTALQPIGASDDAKTLARYGTSAGEDGFVFVLSQLGVAVSADGKYSLTPGGKLHQAANSLRVQDPERAVSGFETVLLKAKAGADAAEHACSEALGPSPIDAAHAKQALSACAITLDAIANKLPPPVDKVVLTNTASLKAAAQAAEPNLGKINELTRDLGKEPRLKGSYSLIAVRFARTFLFSAQKQTDRDAKVKELVSDIETAFEDGSRVEDGSTLLEANSQPRRYDVATGAVFVAGIQDVVVPMLISICPAEGCLTAKDMAWRAPNGWWRSISFDAGIRAKTLDTQDRRQSDMISFLTGASINPVSVLRVSGGLYWFENAQTQKWTGQPYVGITLNVLNAAEILGGLGMGDQVGPSTQPVKN